MGRQPTPQLAFPMPDSVANKPRKLPKQERSRAVVDVLLEATARILTTRGAQGLSTNEIARVAGVSVGSLYQYFPGKAALVAALIERKVELDLEELGGAAMSLVEAPLAELISGVVKATVELHRRDRGLLRALLELVPEVGRYAQVREMAAQGRAMIRAMMEARKHEIRDLDLDLACFITGRALEEVVHAAVLEKPELLDDPRFAEEVTTLLVAFLRR